MSGLNQLRNRHWSNRQRLVVLTFDTPQQANSFDLVGMPPVEALIGGFDIDAVDGDAVVALMEACRDVIDSWDDLAERDMRLDKSPHGVLVERLRRVLFDARQSAMT